MPAAGLRVPASDPAASPSSRRSKLKGRFMLSDPWGGGRLSAGIEAWHGSALLRSQLSLPAGPLALVLLAPSSAPVPLCSVLAALGERVRGMWQGRGRPMGVGGTGSVPRVPRARRQHPICAAGQGWPWRWQVRDGCIAAARPACPACPCLSCLPCLPLPSDHGSEAATEERLHHPRCGKMVSSRSRSRSGSALSPGTLRPRD